MLLLQGHGFAPWSGTEVPYAVQHGQKKKKKGRPIRRLSKVLRLSVSSPFLNHENITICMAHWNKQMRQFWPEAEGLRISAHL